MVKAQVDLRVLQPEVFQSRRQPLRRERRRQAHAERVRILFLADRGHGLRDAIKGFDDFRQQRLALLAEREPAWIPVEQRHTQVILDNLDLVTNRRLGHVEFARGLGKAEQTAGRLETLEAVKWR